MGQKESSLKSFNSNVKKKFVSGIGEYICLKILQNVTQKLQLRFLREIVS